MRKSKAPQSPTPGTIENIRKVVASLREDVKKLESDLHDEEKLVGYLTRKNIDAQAVIRYLENKLDRTNPIRSN
jgi:hypothetical protein